MRLPQTLGRHGLSKQSLTASNLFTSTSTSSISSTANPFLRGRGGATTTINLNGNSFLRQKLTTIRPMSSGDRSSSRSSTSTSILGTSPTEGASSSSSSGVVLTKMIPEWIVTTAVTHPVATIGSVAGLLTLLAVLQYRGAIRRRLKMIREESWLFGAGVTMERIPTETWRQDKDGSIRESGLFANVGLLEMNPAFVERVQKEEEKQQWSLMTLGDYLSSLRPKQLPANFSMPNLVKREIEAGLGAALLNILGPNLGIALLPAVGTGAIQSRAQALASSAASRWFFESEHAISASQDKGGVPLGLLALLAGADLNAKVNSGTGAAGGGDMDAENDQNNGKKGVPPAKPSKKVAVPNFDLSALEKMKVGEIVKGQPSFVDPGDNLVPNDNFVMDADFERIIRRMEEKLGLHPDHQAGHVMSQEQQVAIEMLDSDADEKNKAETTTYDPEDTSMAAPVPINPRLFPDLHLGWGDAQCTHTKHEVLKMRLLALLLNRLGANYQKFASGVTNEKELFSVQMTRDGPVFTRPSQLVEALMASGHQIEVVPSSRLTTFGLALCVKEPDNKWTNVPLGVFIESGFEDKDGNMAPAMMPHSGLDMFIKGPLAGSRADGTPSTLRIQHFIGIEGFCGWKSHEAPLVPFNEAVEQGHRLTASEDVARATRVAALYANTLNGLATNLHLPFGGYGVTSVCNDSAAVIQQCLYGKNTIYPMTSIGKFAQRTMRYAQNFRHDMEQNGAELSLRDEISDLCSIVHSIKQLPNDINSAPSNAQSAAHRMLSTIQPRLPFLLNVDSKQVMESILAEEDAEQASSDRNDQINNSKQRQNRATTLA